MANVTTAGEDGDVSGPDPAPDVSRLDPVRGAHELITICLAVTGTDRVLVLTDRGTRGLAEITANAARVTGASVVVTVLPDIAAGYAMARQEIQLALDAYEPTVTLFAAADPQDLLAWDPTFWAHLERLGARHAHMPALDDVCLGIGMAVDYTRVAQFTLGVRDLLSGSRSAHITSRTGTDLTLTCDPARPWTPFTGLYQCAGEGGRLPQGEVFCTPLSGDGMLAVSVIGYPFNAESGLLDEPLLIEVAAGRAIDLRHPDTDLASRLRDHLTRAPSGLRLAELALGTNQDLPHITGNLLFDENVPGVHIAFGHPFPEYTGADWESPVHVDMVVEQPTVHVDDTAVLTDGRYTHPSVR
ncbi:aminopeptidase [Streptomyces sp. NPDC046821]|uniref:aminopeptidase n=1 Tax=Streptomyces sp. NPDC046821 TaxID=3154702 RepID=UPI0033E9CB14